MRRSAGTSGGKAGGFQRFADSAHGGGKAVGGVAGPGWDLSLPRGDIEVHLGDSCATKQVVGDGQQGLPWEIEIKQLCLDPSWSIM